jgi:isoquinoline 1-oxidoreductase beta subunit
MNKIIDALNAAQSDAITRREFMVRTSAVAGGLGLSFYLPSSAIAQGGANAAPPEVNAWVTIAADDTVTIRIARSEMGQGTMTGLAQLVAEELECDWAKVKTEYPTPGQNLARQRVWGNFSTGGSRGIRESQDYVRKGGAAARMLLLQAAADEWKVPVGECRVAKGVVTHGTKRTSYGKVAAAAAKLPAPDAASIQLKDSKDWQVTGKRLARLDTAEKVTGQQVYGIDLKLPGMLNAAIKDCPVFGGKVKSFNAAAVEKMRGVRKVVEVGDSAVAVVADHWWQAKTALDALPIVWDEGAHAKASSAEFAKVLAAALDAPEAVAGHNRGDAKDAIAKATRKIEAVYAYPHQNHATMEPMNATARYTPDRCEVWTPTQNGESALAATAEASGLPAAKCEVYKIHLGGGFGRRGMTDWIRQAVAIAKQMPGVPIKLLWSREEDMLHGRYHPVTQCKLTAGIDAEGNVSGLHMRIAGQSILAGVFPQNVRNGLDPVVFQGLNVDGAEGRFGYNAIGNVLIDHAMRNPHVPPGFWRGVNLNQNAFYLECFIDEIAHALKQDPLALRRKLIRNAPQHLAVLNAVAERVGWDKPAADIGGQKVHRGLAMTHGFGSYVAACAEVSVSADGELKVHRIVAATDCGNAVNPQQIEAQVEGSFVYGLSALFGACTVKDGRIEQENFHTYPVVQMRHMPKVETIILTSGGFWGGVGEPTIAVALPAVLNAAFAATGKRVREVPLRSDSLKRT